MALLASAVMDRARAVLNDVAIDLYSNEVLLPYLQIAADDLSDELVDHNASVQKEVSADISVAAEATSLTLPEDIITPISLWEKNTDEEDSSFRLIESRIPLPPGVPETELRYYEWREQAINFIGSTIDKIVRLRYYRIPTEIIGANTPVELTHAKSYLAYHTAAMAAEHIGQNLQKAAMLESVAQSKLNKLLKREVKQNQSRPSRRRPFRIQRHRRILV